MSEQTNEEMQSEEQDDTKSPQDVEEQTTFEGDNVMQDIFNYLDDCAERGHSDARAVVKRIVDYAEHAIARHVNKRQAKG